MGKVSVASFYTCVQVTVPLSRIEAAQQYLDDVTKVCGGCTATPGQGQWFGERYVSESVLVFKWWAFESQVAAAGTALRSVVRALLDAGEDAVLVEESDREGSAATLWTHDAVELRD